MHVVSALALSPEMADFVGGDESAKALTTCNVNARSIDDRRLT
jgi:hypothetical protein